MSLGLSHSLSRYKLKFSPDKVYSFSCSDFESSKSRVHYSIKCLTLLIVKVRYANFRNFVFF